MMPEKLWRRSENWVGTSIEDAFVMISLESGRYVSLTATATGVWDAIETPNTIDTIVEKLTGAFEVSAEQCRKSVTELLSKFEEMGLVSSN